MNRAIVDSTVLYWQDRVKAERAFDLVVLAWCYGQTVWVDDIFTTGSIGLVCSCSRRGVQNVDKYTTPTAVDLDGFEAKILSIQQVSTRRTSKLWQNCIEVWSAAFRSI